MARSLLESNTTVAYETQRHLILCRIINVFQFPKTKVVNAPVVKGVDRIERSASIFFAVAAEIHHKLQTDGGTAGQRWRRPLDPTICTIRHHPRSIDRRR